MGHTRIAVLLSLSLLSSPGAAAQTAAGGSGGVALPGPPRKVQEKEEKAFIRSVEKGDAAAVRRFLAAGVSANAGEDRAGGEAVLLRAIRGGHEEVVRLLLDAGAEVGARGNPDLVSALNLAVKAGRPRIVRALLDRRADVNYGDEDGHTNLMVAVWLTAISSLPAEAVGFVVPEDDDATRTRLKVARSERLEILRKADFVLQDEIRNAGLYRELWQSFAVLIAVRTVGVMGDERTYAYPVVVRAVTSDDAMTADWARLPHDLLEALSSRIIAEVPGVNRVALDITSKPPGTIEWE